MNENIDFIKQYAPNISADAEDYSNQTSNDHWFDIASKTNNPLHLDKALDHHDPDVREEAARNSYCNANHLDKALNDEKWFVKAAAAGNPRCTKEHIDKALGDEDYDVRRAAKRNPRYKEYYPNGHQ